MSDTIVPKDQLRGFFERLVRLDAARAEISADMRDLRQEAKAAGFDGAVLMAMLRRYRKEPEDLADFDRALEVYEAALGVNSATAGQLEARRGADGCFEVVPPKMVQAKQARKAAQRHAQVALAMGAMMARER